MMRKMFRDLGLGISPSLMKYTVLRKCGGVVLALVFC